MVMCLEGPWGDGGGVVMCLEWPWGDGGGVAMFRRALG